MRGRVVLLSLIVCLFAGAAAAADLRLGFGRGGYWLNNPVPTDFVLHREQPRATEGAYDQARLTLYKLSDPALLAEITTARALRSLSEAELLRRVVETKPVWQGKLVLANAADTGIPLEAATGALSSGVYVLTAAPDADQTQRVAQWFVRSQLALKTQFMTDRVFAVAYDTKSRNAYAFAKLRWCNAEGKLIGDEISLPESGAALLPRPTDAALLIASGPGEQADFDSVTVPSAPSAVQQLDLAGALIYPSSPVYQPNALFSFLIATPGEAPPTVRINDAELVPTLILPGLWQADAPAGADGQLALTVSRNDKMLAKAIVPAMANKGISAAWLQLPTVITPVRLAPVKVQLLGRDKKPVAMAAGSLLLKSEDLYAQPVLKLPFMTNANGIATLSLNADELPKAAVTYQLQVEIDGQAVTTAKPAGVSVYPAASWLDITSQFSDGAVPENTTARFAVQTRMIDGRLQPATVKYELSRETYKFEWYQTEDGRWTYRTKTTLAAVLDGQAQPVKGVTQISVPVNAGRYRLSVRDLSGALQAEQSFTAGWWLTRPTPETPEAIVLTAQVEGEPTDDAKIAIFVDPPFAAHVWVGVANANSGEALAMADIPDDGGFVYLARGALQPGQPLALFAYGIPSDTNAPLIHAEGLSVAPLGGKVTMALGNARATNAKAETVMLTIAGLPVDQPLDKNIAQGQVALYDNTDQSLWKLIKLEIDTDGKATVDLSGLGKRPEKLRARVFASYADRLNISEQLLDAPVAASEVAKPKKQ